MIINIGDHIPNFSRYNGGWIKTVAKLDKDYSNGYSIVGDFLPVSSGNINLDEGIIYLDCSIEGSRKHQVKNYTLFKIIDGEVFILQEIEDGGMDWATSLWDTIEKELDIVEANKVDDIVRKIRKLDDKQYFQMMNQLRTKDIRTQKFLEYFLCGFKEFEKGLDEQELIEKSL